MITGRSSELAPVLCAHEDVDGIDLEGAGAATGELATIGARSIKRVLRARASQPTEPARRLRAFVEISTVWHTVGQ